MDNLSEILDEMGDFDYLLDIVLTQNRQSVAEQRAQKWGNCTPSTVNVS